MRSNVPTKRCGCKKSRHRSISFVPARRGALAYIEHAADWEQHRRRGFHFPLQAPHGAISEDEHLYALTTLGRLVVWFTEEERPGVAALLWAVAEALGRGPGAAH